MGTGPAGASCKKFAVCGRRLVCKHGWKSFDIVFLKRQDLENYNSSYRARNSTIVKVTSYPRIAALISVMPIKLTKVSKATEFEET